MSADEVEAKIEECAQEILNAWRQVEPATPHVLAHMAARVAVGMLHSKGGDDSLSYHPFNPAALVKTRLR